MRERRIKKRSERGGSSPLGRERERERETRLWRLLAQLRELERPFNKSLAPGYRLFQPFEWKNNKVDRGWMHNGTRGRGMGRNGENKMEKRRREAVETLEERVLLFFKLIINAWLSIRESRVSRHQSWHESYFPRVSWLTLFDWSPRLPIAWKREEDLFASRQATQATGRFAARENFLALQILTETGYRVIPGIWGRRETKWRQG